MLGDDRSTFPPWHRTSAHYLLPFTGVRLEVPQIRFMHLDEPLQSVAPLRSPIGRRRLRLIDAKARADPHPHSWEFINEGMKALEGK